MARGMTLVAAVGLAALLTIAPGTSLAADLCKAVALVDVPAQESPDSILHKGEIDEAITQYRVDKKTGAATFCSHGGYCHPRYIDLGGKKVEALRLTNCNIGAKEPDISGIEEDDTFYDVDVDRTRNSAADLKLDDVDNALLGIGMCSACAGNAADIYIKSPKSRCGSLVGRALNGDKKAAGVLQTNPTYCEEHLPDATPTSNGDTRTPSTLPSDTPAPSRGHFGVAIIFLLVGGLLYFSPSVVAFSRRKRNAPAILVLNLFLGWTFLGWVGALVWALVSDPTAAPQHGA